MSLLETTMNPIAQIHKVVLSLVPLLVLGPSLFFKDPRLTIIPLPPPLPAIFALFIILAMTMLVTIAIPPKAAPAIFIILQISAITVGLVLRDYPSTHCECDLSSPRLWTSTGSVSGWRLDLFGAVFIVSFIPAYLLVYAMMSATGVTDEELGWVGDISEAARRTWAGMRDSCGASSRGHPEVVPPCNVTSPTVYLA